MKHSTNKLLILLCVIALLVLPIVAGKQPVQVATGASTIEIRIPRAEFLKGGAGVHPHIHIYNATNGLIMDNETTDCFLEIYNTSGDHSFQEELDWEDSIAGGDFVIDISGDNFSRLGIYSFLVQCNATAAGMGGFVSSDFRITVDGEDDAVLDNSSGLAVIIFAMALTAIFMFIPTQKLAKTDHLDFMLRGASLLIGIALLIQDTALVMTIAAAGNLGLTQDLVTFLRVLGVVLQVALYVVFLGYFFKIVSLLKEKKDKDRMGEDNG